MVGTEKILIDRFSKIDRTCLMKHVHVLAHDRMRGRMPGDAGYRMAMDYVVDQLKSYGLLPGFSTESYEQPFSLETCRILQATMQLRFPDGSQQKLQLGQDYICRGLSGSGLISDDLVFVGYCSTDEDFNELDGLDLNGKIAVSFKHPPPWATNANPVLPREKAHRLLQYGARALIIVPNPNRHEPDRLSASLVEKGPMLPDFPMIVLAESPAEKLFSFDDNTLSNRQYRLDSFREFMSGPLAINATIHIESENDPNGISWNAAGFLRGSDPVLSNETIIVGAHLDHVGIQGEHVIFHGAQDNASGVAAVLEIAKVFASGPRPSRSLQFVLFGAEEAGLIGSMHYASNAPFTIQNSSLMLNLDCIGAGNGVDMRGRKAYPELFSVFDSLNEQYIKVSDTMESHSPGGADAKPFEDAGIPNMYFVGSNPYRHLHMKSDKPETLNPSLFESISRLAYLVAAHQA